MFLFSFPCNKIFFEGGVEPMIWHLALMQADWIYFIVLTLLMIANEDGMKGEVKWNEHHKSESWLSGNEYKLEMSVRKWTKERVNCQERNSGEIDKEQLIC